MIPDFPKIKKRFENVANQYFKYVHFRNAKFTAEKNRIRHIYDDGRIKESRFSEVSSKGNVTYDIHFKGYFSFIEAFAINIFEMNAKAHELELDEIDKETKETGRLLDGKGKKFSPDLFLKYLKMVEFYFEMGYGYAHILFDRIDSRRYVSTIVISPFNEIQLVNFDAKHKRLIEDEIRSNSKFKKKVDKLIREKRNKWYDRESNRKLVD